MAIKKFELYSSLWSSCDELRGGMGANLLTGRIRLVGTGTSAPDIVDGHRARLKSHLQSTS